MSGTGASPQRPSATMSESSCSGASDLPLRADPLSDLPLARSAAAGPGLPAAASRRPAGRCESVYLLPTRLATVVLSMLQGLMLDCYLMHYNSSYWLAWIAGDVAVLMMFTVAFVISYRQMSYAMQRLLSSGARPEAGPGSPSSVAGRSGPGGCCVGGMSLLGVVATDKEGEGGVCGPPSPGSMPLVYFAWLVYSALVAVRVLLIYKNFAHELTHDVFLGANTLQTTVATSSVIFLLLLLAHHDAAPDSRRRQNIDHLTSLVPFDIVDAADLLAVLASPAARDTMETWITWCVLGVACLNLVLPTLPLMVLSRTQFGARPLPEYLQTLHRLLTLLGVNVPLLATRLLLWHYVQLPVSTFLVKNVAVSFLVLYSFYERDHHRHLQNVLMAAQDINP